MVSKGWRGMPGVRVGRSMRRPWSLALGLVVSVVWLSQVVGAAAAPPKPSAPTTPPFTLRRSTLPATARPPVAAPKGVADPRDIERRVKEVVKKAAPATVAVLMGGGQGSGVIIS